MHRIPGHGTVSHTECALEVNRRFVPEPTVKCSVGTWYNRLIERRGVSLDLETTFKQIQISQNIEKQLCKECNAEFADAQHLRQGRRAHQHHPRLSVLVKNNFPS